MTEHIEVFYKENNMTADGCFEHCALGFMAVYLHYYLHDCAYLHARINKWPWSRK